MSTKKKQIIAIYVTWKRKKGQPEDLWAVTSGGFLQALILQKNVAAELKVPVSWTQFKVFREVIRKGRPA